MALAAGLWPQSLSVTADFYCGWGRICVQIMRKNEFRDGGEYAILRSVLPDAPFSCSVVDRMFDVVQCCWHSASSRRKLLYSGCTRYDRFILVLAACISEMRVPLVLRSARSLYSNLHQPMRSNDHFSNQPCWVCHSAPFVWNPCTGAVRHRPPGSADLYATPKQYPADEYTEPGVQSIFYEGLNYRQTSRLCLLRRAGRSGSGIGWPAWYWSTAAALPPVRIGSSNGMRMAAWPSVWTEGNLPAGADRPTSSV